MAPTSRTFAAGNFDVFDELAEMLAGWILPGGSYRTDVFHHAGLEARTRMLDLGCGTGRLLAQAARREPSAFLVGIDDDRDSIAIARDRARTAPAPIELHLASAERLPFTDAYFDVVTAVFVLGDMASPLRARVLAETARVLKPLGRLLAVDWVRGGGLLARVAGDAVAALPVPVLGRSPRPGRTARLMDAAGFDEIDSPARYCTLSGAAELTIARRPLVG